MTVRMRGTVAWVDVTEFNPGVGRKVRVRIPGGSPEDAKTLEARIRLELRTGVYRTPDRQKPPSALLLGCPTLSEAIEGAWSRHWSRKRKPQTTVRQRLDYLKSEWGSVLLDDLTKKKLAAIVDDLKQGRSDATVRKYLSHLQVVLKSAYYHGDTDQLVSVDPFKRGLGYSRERDGHFDDETEAQILEFIRSLGTRKVRPFVQAPDIADVLELLFETGCRVGELRVLPWNRVDLKAGTIAVPSTTSKSGKAGVVGLTMRAVAILTARKDRGLSQAFDLDYWAVHRAWNAARRHLGQSSNPDFVPHLIRHTTGTRLYQETGDIRLVQRALRHTQLSTTLRYEHAASRAADAVRSALENRKTKI
jgi:integrase